MGLDDVPYSLMIVVAGVDSFGVHGTGFHDEILCTNDLDEDAFGNDAHSNSGSSHELKPSTNFG